MGGVGRLLTTESEMLTLLHSESFPIARYADALGRESISSRSVRTLDNLADAALKVLLVDPAILNSNGGLKLDGRTAVVGVGVEQPRWLTDENIYLHLPQDPSSPV